MAEDFGVLITKPGVSTIGATPNKTFMNTTKPFIKIDTQVATSFQTITLLITTDPPEPVGPATHRYTVVHKFKHGYPYIPALEVLFNVTSPPPGTNYTDKYFQDITVLAAKTVDDYAALYSCIDATYVYFIIDKFNDGVGSANLLTGTNVQITTHVFVEDVAMP